MAQHHGVGDGAEEERAGDGEEDAVPAAAAALRPPLQDQPHADQGGESPGRHLEQRALRVHRDQEGGDEARQHEALRPKVTAQCER